jgi:hypothetical protein
MIFNNCHLLMTLMIALHHFLEMSKKCWPRFRVRNSTLGLPRWRCQVRKVPEPGMETCVILFLGRPGVQETSISGGVTAACVVFPV